MPDTHIAAVILAAGASSRMGGKHKLLEELHGRPLVAHVAEAALLSSVAFTTVVLGHRADEVLQALPTGVTTVRNPDPDRGLASSLHVGLNALEDNVPGALILLGDMPQVRAEDCDALIGAFQPDRVIVPLVEKRRGNPVLWSRWFFSAMFDLCGDRGARSLFERYPGRIIEVPLENRGLLLDIDTQADLKRTRETN